MKHKKGKISTGILYVILLLGVTILSYPFISSWLSKKQGIEVAEDYKKMTVSLSEEEIQEEWEKAYKYNEELLEGPDKNLLDSSESTLPANYNEVLNVDGVMAYIEIPKIDVKLPVYHSVSNEVLEKGIGHIEGTSLPVGGESSHSVLTGHTGLPTAEMLTDLTEMEKGDLFYVHVLGEMLTYEVDKIKVINPDEVTELHSYEGKDYVTLLTCTPYAVNSHRLMVRGKRVYYYNERVNIHWGERVYKLLFIIFFILTVAAIIRRRIIEKKNNNNIGNNSINNRDNNSAAAGNLPNNVRQQKR